MSEQKPPLGVMPKMIWDNIRVNDIMDAMQRYAVAEKPIPVEWLEELKSLLWRLNNDQR